MRWSRSASRPTTTRPSSATWPAPSSTWSSSRAPTSFRGNGFYYLRDNKLAATPWATNRAGGSEVRVHAQHLRRHDRRADPAQQVVLLRQLSGRTSGQAADQSFATVVPDAWRQGDLSSLLNRATLVIRDPLTGQPFPNNQIPVSRFSQFARNLFADETLYPRANVARPLSDFRENYRGTTASEQNVDQFDVKFDWNASAQRQAVRALLAADGRFAARRRPSCRCRSRRRRTTRSGAWPPTGTASSATRSSTICWSATTTRLADSFPLDPLGLGDSTTQLGIAGDQAMRGLTNIRMGNDRHQNRQRRNRHATTANQIFQVNERLTWLRGRHALKFGGSWNYYHMQVALSRQQWPQRVHRLRQLQFHGRAVCRLPAGSGVAEGPRLARRRPWTHLQHRIGLFAADDFKITDNLTLNLGLRWAYTSPFVEQDDRQANFDLTNAQPSSPARTATAARSTTPITTAGNRASALPTGPASAGCSAAATASRSTWKAPAPTCGCRSIRRSSSRRTSATTRPAAPATLRPDSLGLQSLDRPSGQVRAWDPNLQAAVHAAVELLRRIPAGIASPRSTSATSATGRRTWSCRSTATSRCRARAIRRTWLPVQQRRPLYPFNPRLSSISHDGIAGPFQLQWAAVDLQAAAVERAGFRRQLHL